MASTYVNDLRLNEMATGDASGSWGTITNTNLELIGEAFGYGTESIGNADTTITMADGASDAARSFYLKITSSADLTTTRVITLAPNTVSKVWMIENATSGSQIITIKQGTGATINIPNGHVKMVATDGAGSGGAVLDLLTDLNVATNLFVKNAGTGDGSTANIYLQTAEADIAADDVIGKINFQAPNEGTGTDAILVSAAIQAISEGDFSSSSNATSLNFMTGASEAAATKMTLTSGGNLKLITDTAVLGFGAGNDVTLTHVHDTGLLLNSTMALQFNDASQFINAPSATVLDINATDEIELNATLVDLNGNLDVSGTALVTGVLTTTAATVFNGGFAANDGSTITTADNTTQLTLKSTDADASAGPRFDLTRDSASPADGDNIGRIRYLFDNDAGEQTEGIRIDGVLQDVSDGTEDVAYVIDTIIGGTLRERVGYRAAETVFNDDSIDVDFRVESNGNANMLFVDGGNDRVGIGTNSPAHALDVNGSLSSNGNENVMRIAAADATNAGGVTINSIYGASASARVTTIFSIDGQDQASPLAFGTGTTERMRISPSGSLGIGVADGDVTSDGNSSRTYVGIIGAGNRGRLNIGSTASNGADGGAISFLNGTNELGALYNDASSGSQTTGTMFFTANGKIDIRASDEVVFNQDSADVDFRVETDGNANMIFVDGGNDVVSIGGATVEAGDTFAVLESGANVVNSRFRNANADANGVRVVFEKASASPADNDEIAQLDFLGRDSAGNAELYAGIQAFIDDASSGTEDGVLRFGSVTNATYRNRLDILPNETVINQDGVGGINFRIESDTNENMFFIDSGDNTIAIGTTNTAVATQNTETGVNFNHVGRIYSTATDHHDFNMIDDGEIFRFRSATTAEGNISVSGSTVSYNGFSGTHESSGIAKNVAIGTVVSTIDELDVYAADGSPKAGQTRADHAKVKVSDSVGDKRVYGVVTNFNEYDKAIIAAVGIGSVKVTGACVGGDLLESNGDGTAKVQSDDIIRSKTIAKVTIGNSNTGVKLVSCVLYCG